MKFVVVLADGMADYPLQELGNKTPLQAADKPSIDCIARYGDLGMVKTIPPGMYPGSDTANLSVMGYDPRTCYSGRSPFEAVSMGVPLKDTDVTFRCNFVTLSADEPYEEKVMFDHSADEISTEEAGALLASVQEILHTEVLNFYPGVSYRHILVWNEAPFDFSLTPPHDILGKKIKGFLPAGPYGEMFLQMMKKSHSFLKDHPVNIRRSQKGLGTANSIWLWGEGKKPAVSSFYEKYHVRGSVISAVDLVKGIGLCAGLKSIDVPGATGNYQTNYLGKAQAALDALEKGDDFVYIHIEAPDECGHRHEIENKVKAIESIDKLVIKTIMDGLDGRGEDYKMMVLPDHPTPLKLRTHTAEPVPFLIFQSNRLVEKPQQVYDEFYPRNTGLYFVEGYRLMDYFMSSGLLID